MDYPIYFRNVAKEKLPKEGSEVSIWATNLSQSINPGWVIILTPLVVAFFTFLRGRKKEPSTPTKIAFGDAHMRLKSFSVRDSPSPNIMTNKAIGRPTVAKTFDIIIKGLSYSSNIH